MSVTATNARAAIIAAWIMDEFGSDTANAIMGACIDVLSACVNEAVAGNGADETALIAAIAKDIRAVAKFQRGEQ